MTSLVSPQAKHILGLALTVLLIGGLVGTALAAPTASSPDVSGTSTQADGVNVRVVHASPDAPTVDVTIDNETVLSNVSFGSVSEYISVSQGLHTVTIAEANDSGAVLFEGDVQVDAAGNFTIGVTGEPGDPLVFDDVPPAVTDGEAAVRLVHLAPDAPTVDVTIQGTDTVLAENVSFANATEYASVPAGNYTLEVREDTASNDGDVLATVDVSVENGTAYSAFALGANETTEAPVQVVLATDTMNATAGETEAPETVTEEPGTETEAATETETETATVTETETATTTETDTANGTTTGTESP